MAAVSILKIRKTKYNISATEWLILTKFNTMMRLVPVDLISKYNFAISKIQDSSSGRFDKSTRNAWQSLAYSPLGAIVSSLANICEKHLLTDQLSA